MITINENYLKLQDSYLFSTIAKKIAKYTEENPDKKVIKLGIGDVTLPLAPVVGEAIKKRGRRNAKKRNISWIWSRTRV